MGKAESDTNFKALPASPPTQGQTQCLRAAQEGPLLNRKENLSRDLIGPEPDLRPEPALQP